MPQLESLGGVQTFVIITYFINTEFKIIYLMLSKFILVHLLPFITSSLNTPVDGSYHSGHFLNRVLVNLNAHVSCRLFN